MLRPHTLFGSLIIFAIISACESNPSINNGNSSVYSDTLDSRYKGKGIVWVTELHIGDQSGNAIYSQPDSNISNFVPVDTVNNDSISVGYSVFADGLFGDGRKHYPACQAFTDTTSICGNVGELEFIDSSLNLKGYKQVTIKFSIDSTTPNLTVSLTKRRQPEVVMYTGDAPTFTPDSNDISKTINATKGINTILLDHSALPEGGTGYSLSFFVPDSIPGYVNFSRPINVNRLRVIITK